MNTLRVETVVYEGQEQKQLIGLCKLASKLSDKAIEYKNAKGETKSYNIANLKGLLPNGKEVDLTASVPARNQEIMAEQEREFTIGESYLTTVTAQPDKNDPTKLIFFARMSHLQNAGTDNVSLMEAFGAEFGLASVATTETVGKQVAVEA